MAVRTGGLRVAWARAPAPGFGCGGLFSKCSDGTEACKRHGCPQAQGCHLAECVVPGPVTDWRGNAQSLTVELGF